MERLPRLLAAALLTLALTVSGCMGQRAPERAPEDTEKKSDKKPSEKSGDTKKSEDPVASGAGKMQSQLADLREALNTGDPNEVRRQARKIDDTWEGYERRLESRNPDMYNRVEASLNAVLAGVQVVPFNNGVIGAAMDSLSNTLEQVKDTKGVREEPKKVDPKTGAAAMRQHLSELNKAVDSGDTAKMQEKATAVDRAWTQFEDAVRSKSKKQYETVEDHLHAILAGVRASPVDKNKVKQQISGLDKQLEGLSK